MTRFKRIVCPVDFSEASKHAFEYAVALARRYRAKLYLVHVVSPLVGMGRADITTVLNTIKRGAAKHLVRLTHQGAIRGVSPIIVLRVGEPDALIRQTAIAKKADVVIMGSHGLRGFQRWMIGSTTERLLRHLPIPILILPPCGSSKPATPNIKHLLVTTDFSKGSESAVSYALSLAQEFQARLTLLHVLPNLSGNISGFNDGVIYVTRQEQDQLKEEIRNRLKRLLPSTARHQDRFRVEVSEGIASQQIRHWTEKTKADLLVMNIHGKGLIERALLGATAERVIRAAPCPILAVPPEADAPR